MILSWAYFFNQMYCYLNFLLLIFVSIFFAYIKHSSKISNENRNKALFVFVPLGESSSPLISERVNAHVVHPSVLPVTIIPKRTFFMKFL